MFKLPIPTRLTDYLGEAVVWTVISITNVGLILTKLWWFQLFVESQNSNFELFWKKIKFLGFHAVVLVKTFPLMYQLLM